MHIGTDLCDPKRIEKIYAKFGAKFLTRILTPKEIEQIHSTKSNLSLFQRIAGRYAGKEAVAKVFGTGIGKKLSFQDIEILRDDKTGAPLVNLKSKARKLAVSLDIDEIKISISHEKQLAVAFAVGV